MRKFWISHGKLEEYSGDGPDREPLIVTPDLIGSLGTGGLHYPVLDVDLPCHVRPSQTPGHFHLFIDKGLEWEQYEKLLLVLAEVGIIEQGYANASIERKQTFVALHPWKAEQ